jgi:hypothetical protein
MKTTNQTKPTFNEWIAYIRRAANRTKHELTASDLITKFNVKIKYDN